TIDCAQSRRCFSEKERQMTHGPPNGGIMRANLHCSFWSRLQNSRVRGFGARAWSVALAGLTAFCIGTPAMAQEQTVTLWHSMGAKNGEALNALVERFNTQNAGK